jgi:hypothetical protein
MDNRLPKNVESHSLSKKVSWVGQCSPFIFFPTVLVLLGVIVGCIFLAVYSIQTWLQPMYFLIDSPENSYVVQYQESPVDDALENGYDYNSEVLGLCPVDYVSPYLTFYSVQQWNNFECMDAGDSSVPFSANPNDIVCIYNKVYYYYSWGRRVYYTVRSCSNVNDNFQSIFRSMLAGTVSSLSFVTIIFFMIIWLAYSYFQGGSATDSSSNFKTSLLGASHMSSQSPLNAVVGESSSSANMKQPQSKLLASEKGEGVPTIDSNYSSIIPSERKKLLGCIEVEPSTFGLLSLLLNAGSIISLIVSIATSGDQTTQQMSGILVLFVLVTYLAVPVWQKYSIYDKTVSQLIHCEENLGCLCCAVTVVISGLCKGNFQFVKRDNHPEHCLFVPFSQYNLWYMFRNPTTELNPLLPTDVKTIGFGRVYFALLSINMRGSLNYYVFVNSITSFIVANATGFTVSTAFALLSLLSALFNLKVYIISTFYGFALLPYTAAITLIFCFSDKEGKYSKFLQVEEGTWTYSVIIDLWEHAKRFY